LLYETSGDKTTALQYYYKVNELNPDNKSITDKIRKMVGSSQGSVPANVTVPAKTQIKKQ
jgi:hypothetical protein